jgi:hypothetical protein
MGLLCREDDPTRSDREAHAAGTRFWIRIPLRQALARSGWRTCNSRHPKPRSIAGAPGAKVPSDWRKNSIPALTFSREKQAERSWPLPRRRSRTTRAQRHVLIDRCQKTEQRKAASRKRRRTQARQHGRRRRLRPRREIIEIQTCGPESRRRGRQVVRTADRAPRMAGPRSPIVSGPLRLTRLASLPIVFSASHLIPPPPLRWTTPDSPAALACSGWSATRPRCP